MNNEEGTDVTYDYPLDLTGTAASNLVTNEPQVITEINGSFSQIIVPDYAPFYLANLEVVHISTDGVETTLQADTDYFVAYPYQDLARETGKLTFGTIVVVNRNAKNRFRLKYQTIGDKWAADPNHVKQKLLELAYNPRVAYWDQITNVQDKFPPEHHIHDASDFDRWPELISAINRVTQAIVSRDYNESSIYPTVVAYLESFLPNMLTKEAVGLDKVENYPVATQDDIDQLSSVSKYVLLSQVVDIVNSIYVANTGVDISDIKTRLTSLEQALAQFELNTSTSIQTLTNGLASVSSSVASLSNSTSTEFQLLNNSVSSINSSLSAISDKVDTIEEEGTKVKARYSPSAFLYYLTSR